MAQILLGPRLSPRFPHFHFPPELLDKQPAMAEMIVAELALFALMHLQEVHQRPDPVRKREMVCMFVSLVGKKLDFARIDRVVVPVVET